MYLNNTSVNIQKPALRARESLDVAHFSKCANRYEMNITLCLMQSSIILTTPEIISLLFICLGNCLHYQQYSDKKLNKVRPSHTMPYIGACKLIRLFVAILSRSFCLFSSILTQQHVSDAAGGSFRLARSVMPRLKKHNTQFMYWMQKYAPTLSRSYLQPHGQEQLTDQTVFTSCRHAIVCYERFNAQLDSTQEYIQPFSTGIMPFPRPLYDHSAMLSCGYFPFHDRSRAFTRLFSCWEMMKQGTLSQQKTDKSGQFYAGHISLKKAIPKHKTYGIATIHYTKGEHMHRIYIASERRQCRASSPMYNNPLLRHPTRYQFCQVTRLFSRTAFNTPPHVRQFLSCSLASHFAVVSARRSYFAKFPQFSLF